MEHQLEDYTFPSTMLSYDSAYLNVMDNKLIKHMLSKNNRKLLGLYCFHVLFYYLMEEGAFVVEQGEQEALPVEVEVGVLVPSLE